MWSVSLSEVYYWCVNTINCTGKNASKDLLLALGEADANMYLCSKELRPGENNFSFILTLRIFPFVQDNLLFEKSY